MFKIVITGHRLKGQEEEIQNWIVEQIENLQKQHGNIMLIDGMTGEIDQDAAVAALQHGAQVSCYFPYRYKLSGVQEYIVSHAAETQYICDGYQSTCYFKRDRRMVDDCDLLLVVCDRNFFGGTYYIYQYALERGKDILIFPWEERKNSKWEVQNVR